MIVSKYLMVALATVMPSVSAGDVLMKLTPDWEYVADTVMGGVSTGDLSWVQIEGRKAARLKGKVSLENNGGFIQMAFDLADGAAVDASAWHGVEMTVIGNGAPYEVRLRTTRLERPWQSYRAKFQTSSEWQTVRLPWDAFEPRKTEAAFEPSELRRLGILAYGVEMDADVAVASIGFYR